MLKFGYRFLPYTANCNYVKFWHTRNVKCSAYVVAAHGCIKRSQCNIMISFIAHCGLQEVRFVLPRVVSRNFHGFSSEDMIHRHLSVCISYSLLLLLLLLFPWSHNIYSNESSQRGNQFNPYPEICYRYALTTIVRTFITSTHSI